VEQEMAAFKARGWKNPGYHYLIDRNGKIHNLLDESGVANGVKGYNQNGIHISWMGGVDANLKPVDNRTVVQKIMLKTLVKRMMKKYPKAKVCGHRDLSPDLNRDGKITPNEWTKVCPCFDVREEYKDFL
jgi:N-acetylmuramoyl-L-alanine amidase